MVKEEKVLIVVDMDNLFHYFWYLGTLTAKVIDHYRNGRPLGGDAKIFISVDRGLSEHSGTKRDRFAGQLVRTTYFDIDWTVIEPNFEHYQMLDGDTKVINSKPWKNRGYGDADVCSYIYENMSACSTIMLFAMDKHYSRMITHLQKIGKKVELYHSGSGISTKLSSSCEHIVNMSDQFHPDYPEKIQEIFDEKSRNSW